MKVHQIEGYIQNIYLVEYNHGLLLLDGCCRADVTLLTHYIKVKLHRSITDLKIIVVTHMHPDHAGAANKLRKISGCRILSADKANQWYQGINGILMHWIDVILTLYVGKKLNKGFKNVAYSRKLNPDIRVNEGDVIPEFEDWQVIETPGHTDRDLSIYHSKENCIYVADLFIKLRRNYISPFPIFHPNKYKVSLRKVAELNPKTVMLAHGGQVSMNSSDIAHLIKTSPKTPRTPLRATLQKFKKITGINLPLV